MALRATPTIAICLTAGVAAGVALARPADQQAPAPVAAAVAEATPAPAGQIAEPDTDSPYLVDGAPDAVDDSEAAATPAPVSIAIEGFAFAPSAAVAAGSPIEVVNVDSADHTLTATGGEFDTGPLGQDQLGSFSAPSAPGTYEFFCEIHPSMTGALVVS